MNRSVGDGDGRRASRYRWWVLAALCSLAFLTYFDRICIMRVQGDIERDLGLATLTAADEEQLRAEGRELDPAAREKAGRDRATARMGAIDMVIAGGHRGTARRYRRRLDEHRRGGRWHAQSAGRRAVSIRHGWSAAFVLFGAVYLVGALAWLRIDAGQPLRSAADS